MDAGGEGGGGGGEGVAFEMKYLGALEKVSYQLIINPIWIFIDS